ncbi:hypothetical protein HMPREF1531_02546 [Propionibacterium sp. oral taxon 192 str. F0372]|uniref:alpha/beta fold hydrolase n=1 Tax=Propionibacterium sp. oral taxon 192 TaxID=671222 RepID=UPI0003537507|nr:alpha/beta hydrolase [Propionibacterium sp. oral taxon 192]EPH00434.1 hypothetical protein HMPREF1531_02546 [Propionibacterium sp. oral taxon 192 str. F0372]
MQYNRIGANGYAEHKHVGKRMGLRRKMRWAVGGALLALVIGMLFEQPQVGHWRSETDRNEYQSAYQELIASLGGPDETIDIATSLGIVHVNVWHATGDGAPVMLLPGRSSGSAMWVENIREWRGKRTVYAPDPMGDAGFSAQSVPLATVHDQAKWVAETIENLGKGPVHLVGHSFGGSVAAIAAADHPDLVASVSLIEPVFVIENPPASMMFWASLTLLPIPQSWKDHALGRVAGTEIRSDAKEPMARLIRSAGAGYSAELPTPQRFTDEQWRNLQVPMRLDIAGDSKLAGGQRAIDRIKALVPQAQTRLWPGTTHSLPMEAREELGVALDEFWSDNER